MSTHRDSIWTAPTNSSGQQKLPTTHKGPRLAPLRGRHQKACPSWGIPTEPSLLFWAVMFFCNTLLAPPPCAMFGFPRTRHVQFLCSHGNMRGRRVRRRSNCPQLPTRWMKGLGWSLHLFGVYLILYTSQVNKSLSENQTGRCSLSYCLSVAASEL